MTATSPAKFRFDLDLGHREERNSVLTESAMVALVGNARADGYREGFTEGERSATVRAADPPRARPAAVHEWRVRPSAGCVTGWPG